MSVEGPGGCSCAMAPRASVAYVATRTSRPGGLGIEGVCLKGKPPGYLIMQPPEATASFALPAHHVASPAGKAAAGVHKTVRSLSLPTRR